MNHQVFTNLLEVKFPDYQWSVPPDLKMGILTTNQAFIEAKATSANPKEVAERIKLKLEDFLVLHNLHNEFTVKTVGPYINLDITAVGLAEFVVKQDQFQLERIQKNVILDYVSPNVARPLHAGHIRNANLGDSLRRILQLKYTNLKTQNYWGDWGVQFGILIWGWKQFQNLQELEVKINGVEEKVKIVDYVESPVDVLSKVYVWANQQSEVVQDFAEIVRAEFVKLEQGDSENRALWKKFLDSSKANLKGELKLLNIPEFDFEEGESYYENNLRKLYEVLETNNIWQKEGLARYIDLETLQEKWVNKPIQLEEKLQNLGRCYLVSSQGYTTYIFRDVAARWQWARDHKSEIMISVTGNEQLHSFKQLFVIVGYLSSLDFFRAFNSQEIIDKMQWHNLIHLSYGLLKLPSGKMSARKGNFLRARDLINTVQTQALSVLKSKSQDSSYEVLSSKAKVLAIAALKWYDLARDSVSDITLDLDKIMSFEGNTGVYQLYTVARINSILRKNNVDHNLEKTQTVSTDLIDIETLNLEEIIMLKTIYTLPNILESICQNYKPHLLCNHLYEITSKINSWYTKHSVSSEADQTRKNSLISLCLILKEHLKNCLNLLGIQVLDEL
ncbi:MAG: arginine--tRNA ligase [Patescibacteria group bacterium]